MVKFVCNICDSECEVQDKGTLHRDVPSCPTCGSTARVRSVVTALSTALFGRSLHLSEFPERPDLIGAGLTDWGYTEGLAAKLGYRNTYYDQEPRLDITDPPEEMEGTLDFLISSDVFEHVPPPVKRAFEGAFRLLKPGGIFVLTVPYLRSGDMQEHYPELHDYELVESNGSKVLVNTTADGRRQVFDDLRFHGGRGFTLEMRTFSHDALLEHLRAAGFDQVTDWQDRIDDPCWVVPHSYPLVARRS